MKEDTTKIKVSIPLINDIELKEIDNLYNDIADKYIKTYVKEKDLVIAQYIIKKLREENQQLKKELENKKNYYRNIVNNQLAECLEPDCEDFYLAEIEGKAEERDLYKSVIDEVREYVYQNEYCRFGHIDGAEADYICKILDKANIREDE